MIATRILSVLILALAGALAWVWLVPSGAWVPPRPIMPEIPAISTDAGGAAPRSSEQVLSRPVFWPSRRLATAPAEPPPPGLVENTQVLGLLGQGDQAVAIVRFEDKVSRLTKGKMLAGWRFEGAEGGDVLFARGEERQRIPMTKKLIQELPRRGGTTRSPAAAATQAPNGQQNVPAPRGMRGRRPR